MDYVFQRNTHRELKIHLFTCFVLFFKHFERAVSHPTDSTNSSSCLNCFSVKTVWWATTASVHQNPVPLKKGESQTTGWGTWRSPNGTSHPALEALGQARLGLYSSRSRVRFLKAQQSAASVPAPTARGEASHASL